MTEPIIKVKRLAYVRFSAPDLTKAEAFLEEFGFQVVARKGGSVYRRGSNPGAHCYVLTQGTSGVTAIAFAPRSALSQQRSCSTTSH